MALRFYHHLASSRLALLFTALAGFLFWLLSRGLALLPPGAPSIFDLQLAFSAPRLASVLEQWGEAGVRAYVEGMWLDFLYPLAYALALSGWIAALTRRAEQPPARWQLTLFALPFLAAALDYVENLLHLLMFAVLQTLPPVLVFLASLAAAVKWSLAGVSVLAVFLLALRKWRL